jgi:N-acetyl-anhydromuramyl-L-alanine amidase AmpD
MSDGICPFAVWRPTANFGYPQGAHGQNKPVVFVDHIMDGWKRTLDDAGWREPAGVGVHFGIGRDGSVSQYTSIVDASWGNGISGSIRGYDRGNPRLAHLETLGQWATVPYAGTTAYALVSQGRNVLNTHSISIEHEGFPGDVWTAEMTDASIRVKRWCLDELARLGMPMDVGPDMLVGHYQIDPVNRARCPGPEWPREAILEALMDAPTKAEFGALFALVLKLQDAVQALGGALFDLARHTYGDVDPRVKAIEERLAALKGDGK